MATLISNGSGGFSLPQTLTQGQSYMGGQVLYDSNTGKPLSPGQTTTSRPTYGDLIPSTQPQPNPPVGGTLPPALAPTAPVNPSTVSFTAALLQILKDAQNRNSTGQTALSNQSNQIKGTALGDAASTFNNPLLAPNSGTSLGNSAVNEFDPATGAIKTQQDQATRNLSDIKDIINTAGDNYQKEQDRIAKAKADAITAANPKLTATEKYNQTLGSYANGFESGSMLADGYTPIKAPSGYLTLAAWHSALNDAVSKGISKKDFILQYGDQLNPNMLADYGLTGIEQAYITKPKTSIQQQAEDAANGLFGG